MESNHAHHWVLESFDAKPGCDTVEGVCKTCNEVKDFPKYCEVVGASWKTQSDAIREHETSFVPGLTLYGDRWC